MGDDCHSRDIYYMQLDGYDSVDHVYNVAKNEVVTGSLCEGESAYAGILNFTIMQTPSASINR